GTGRLAVAGGAASEPPLHGVGLGGFGLRAGLLRARLLRFLRFLGVLGVLGVLRLLRAFRVFPGVVGDVPAGPLELDRRRRQELVDRTLPARRTLADRRIGELLNLLEARAARLALIFV